ncbi:MAG TPA: hypothetical protein VNG51_10085 [Ktedonobacteraceae bacterium]|nr:hypothetical protein [Ktedonobacteraceae bacterium]
MFDNKRPDDPDYPTTEPREFRANNDNLLVHVGDYIVNGDGDMLIATTANDKDYPNDFLRSINEGFFRAKYIGNRDDYLEYANQCRLATPEEIERAKHYVQSGFKTTEKGQLVLL